MVQETRHSLETRELTNLKHLCAVRGLPEKASDDATACVTALLKWVRGLRAGVRGPDARSRVR